MQAAKLQTTPGRSKKSMFDYREIRSFELADDLVTIASRLHKIYIRMDAHNVLQKLKHRTVDLSINVVEATSLQDHPEKALLFEMSFESLKDVRYELSKARTLGLCSEPEFFHSYKIVNELERNLCSLIASSQRKKLLAAQG
ncbi:MAG: hypothetical protein PWQ57_89 [Desulfovibrionales bacterium]|jgi:hypothetical protein|nr:hypothetical protein [Desulfovibrionales bacterium]